MDDTIELPRKFMIDIREALRLSCAQMDILHLHTMQNINENKTYIKIYNTMLELDKLL